MNGFRGSHYNNQFCCSCSGSPVKEEARHWGIDDTAIETPAFTCHTYTRAPHLQSFHPSSSSAWCLFSCSLVCLMQCLPSPAEAESSLGKWMIAGEGPVTLVFFRDHWLHTRVKTQCQSSSRLMGPPLPCLDWGLMWENGHQLSP